eukprot:9130916-Alexandrium_andersonii.AAC.1
MKENSSWSFSGGAQTPRTPPPGASGAPEAPVEGVQVGGNPPERSLAPETPSWGFVVWGTIAPPKGSRICVLSSQTCELNYPSKAPE